MLTPSIVKGSQDTRTTISELLCKRLETWKWKNNIIRSLMDPQHNIHDLKQICITYIWAFFYLINPQCCDDVHVRLCWDCCRAANAMFCSMVGRCGGGCGWITSGTRKGRDRPWSVRIADDSGIDSRRRRRRRAPILGEDGGD